MNTDLTDHLLNPKRREKSKQKWIITFADMMMLLLCFFVLLFSFSNTSARRFEAVSQSFSAAFGLPVPFSLQDSGTSIVKLESGDSILGTRRYSEDSPPQTKVTVVETQNNTTEINIVTNVIQQYITSEKLDSDFVVDLSSNLLTIQFGENSAFASGSGFLQPKGEKSIEEIAAFLKDFPGRIQVNGHTDNLPVVNDLFADNVELSIARASAVAEVMGRILTDRTITISGKGDAEPVASNDTAEGRAQNRRVEILVFHGSAKYSVIPNLKQQDSE